MLLVLSCGFKGWVFRNSFVPLCSCLCCWFVAGLEKNCTEAPKHSRMTYFFEASSMPVSKYNTVSRLSSGLCCATCLGFGYVVKLAGFYKPQTPVQLIPNTSTYTSQHSAGYLFEKNTNTWCFEAKNHQLKYPISTNPH